MLRCVFSSPACNSTNEVVGWGFLCPHGTEMRFLEMGLHFFAALFLAALGCYVLLDFQYVGISPGPPHPSFFLCEFTL